MKPIKVLSLFFVILLIVGCSGGPESSNQPENSVPKTTTETSTGETATKTSQKEVDDEPLVKEIIKDEIKDDVVEKEKVMSDEVVDLLSNLNKVKSFSYFNLDNGETIHVKGNNMRIDLASPAGKISDKRYNKIILDNSAKTAYLYCDDRRRCDTEIWNTYYEGNYDDFKVTITPYSWISDVKYAELSVGTSQVIDNVKTFQLVYEDESENTIKAWVGNFYALPYEVSVISPSGSEKKYQYRQIAVNRVKDSDVQLPSEFILAEN